MISGSERRIELTMSGRESYGLSGRESYGLENNQSATATLANSMRLAFNSDGTAVYKTPEAFQAATATAGTTVDVPAVTLIQEGSGKRKRGRPRKYAPDGSLTQRSQPVSSPPSAEISPKKGRGRPPGSGRKLHMAASMGSTGIGFTPHVMIVKAGEDVLSKIMSFSQHGSRAVCVLSANGAISNVTLRQSATSGGTVTVEGRFEILSLSGSFLLSESAGQRSRTGGLSVLLSGPNGNVLGGGVAGLLTAASLVQVVLGSFNAERQKEAKMGNSSDPMSAPARLVQGPSATFSPPLHGTFNESSGGLGSPLNTGACNNSDPQGLTNINWK
ncbi:putative DNA-binding protein ESCAROLA [Tripterygium wilfordii]|uniref:AT-hook motif nuclear-localized protein n=1 Tax=Tripterygium wilfordii TaxID=458696 RepID=A0A7J7E3D8_TRIWF|nr:AT-hook motif nuclear-localized protein 10-like isoform X2 [Tripterygium wilfordii]XP_038707016.1 AT-hook motif nuclear-localized protein 10-like isoform X2 [Tripterygium wilfordii]KAF5753115.1 putative DNA-binding protein ESCAROLA [Tripterygium wilfordii]